MHVHAYIRFRIPDSWPLSGGGLRVLGHILQYACFLSGKIGNPILHQPLGCAFRIWVLLFLRSTKWKVLPDQGFIREIYGKYMKINQFWRIYVAPQQLVLSFSGGLRVKVGNGAFVEGSQERSQWPAHQPRQVNVMKDCLVHKDLMSMGVGELQELHRFIETQVINRLDFITSWGACVSLGSNGWFVMLKDGWNFDWKEGGRCCFNNVPRFHLHQPSVRSQRQIVVIVREASPQNA